MEETQVKSGSGLAVAGLVLGILAIAGSFLPIINNLSFFIALIGGVLSIIALVGALRGKHTAKGMSIAGVVLAVVSVVVVLATQSAYSAALKSAADELESGDAPVSSTQSEAAPAAESKDEAKPEESAADKAQADYSNMNVGDTVDLKSGLSITVNSVTPGPERYDGTPTTCVNVTYANNGSESESFNQFDWKSLDANGVEQSSTYTSEKEQLDSGKLRPGGTVTGNVYFEGTPAKVLYYSNMFQSDSQVAWNV